MYGLNTYQYPPELNFLQEPVKKYSEQIERLGTFVWDLKIGPTQGGVQALYP